MLRSVQHGHLVLDAFVLEESLGLASDVLAPSIRVEGPNVLSGFHFGTGDKFLKVVCDLRLCLEAIDVDLS
jgi:hypothetical protein